MPATFTQRVDLPNGTLSVRLYTGDGKPSDTPPAACLGLVGSDEAYFFNGTSWGENIGAAGAMLVSATAVAGAKLVLAEPTGGGTSAVTMQAPALAANRTITVPDADVNLGNIAANTLKTAKITLETVADGTKMDFAEATGGGVNKVTIQAPAALGSDVVVSLPQGNLDLDLTASSQVYKAEVTIPGGNGAGSVGQLNAAPVQILAAPPAGFVAEVVTVQLFLDFATAAYDGAGPGEVVEVRYTNAGGAIAAVSGNPTGFADAVADAYMILTPGADVRPVPAAVLVLRCAAGSWFAAAGDSPVKVRVYYRLRAATW
jgi:hypothetical protein